MLEVVAAMNLTVWIESEVEALNGWRLPEGNICMGFPCWGDEYMARLNRYWLTSALGSTAWMRRTHCVIWVDGGHPCCDAFFVKIRPLPPEILKLDRYTILGACQKIMFRVAHKSGCGWHGGMPDVVYPKGYFDRLLALSESHEAILNLSLWVDQQKAGPNLNLWRQDDGTLPIPPLALGDIGWRCLHPSLAACVLNDRLTEADMPFSHFLAWRAKREIHLRCTHIAPVYLSARLCGLAADLPIEPIDSQLPSFIGPDQPFYIPKPEDGLNAIELAHDKPETQCGTFKDFVRQLAPAFTEPFRRYFRADCRVPALPTESYLTAAAIAEQAAHIENCLVMERGE